MTKFFLDNPTRNKYDSAHMDFEEHELYPESDLGRAFIPNYLYLPFEVLDKLRLKNTDIEELPHIQQLLWARVKEAQYKAYTSKQFRWDIYYREHQHLAKSPFVTRFRSQKHTDPHQIQLFQVVQHMKAHEYCAARGGPHMIPQEEFYDLFIRPLGIVEFDVGQCVFEIGIW